VRQDAQGKRKGNRGGTPPPETPSFFAGNQTGTAKAADSNLRERRAADFALDSGN
jgi:hypothetical protein